METDKKITENNDSSRSDETIKRKNKTVRVVSWQSIITIAVVVVVLGFITSYSAITGNASLCIATSPAEKTQQAITEKEPYVLYKDVDVPYDYIITYELVNANFYDYLYRKFGKVELKNTDAHSGIFTVVGKFLLDGKEEKQILSYDVPPERTKLFYFEYFDKYKDTDNASFTYEVIPPNKKVQKQTTEYRDVEKTKDVAVGRKVSCL